MPAKVTQRSGAAEPGPAKSSRALRHCRSQLGGARRGRLCWSRSSQPLEASDRAWLEVPSFDRGRAPLLPLRSMREFAPRRARSQHFGQHPSDGVRRRIDAQQRSQRRGQVHRLGVSAVSSRLERKAIESQRHMRVVGVGRSVVGAADEADGEGTAGRRARTIRPSGE